MMTDKREAEPEELLSTRLSAADVARCGPRLGFSDNEFSVEQTLVNLLMANLNWQKQICLQLAALNERGIATIEIRQGDER